jgi:glycosyltransferase involved in cell wall biosynthesis
VNRSESDSITTEVPCLAGLQAMVSVVVPCYQSATELLELENALVALHKEIQEEYRLEVVFVDDGSTDSTLTGLQKLKQSAPFECTIVVLSGNFGSYNALHAGILNASGDAIIQLHADLQDSPKHIPLMLSKWKQGAKLVIGQRVKREEDFSTRFFSGVYHWMVKRFALPHVPEGGYDLILFDREIGEHLKQIDVHNINLVYLISWLSQRYESVPVVREARKTGQSQWSFSKKVKLVIDTLIGFSDAPTRLFRLLAVFELLLFPVFAFLVAQSNWETTIKLCLIIGASWIMAMLIGITLLSEILWRTLVSARKRPPYIIEKVIQ